MFAQKMGKALAKFANRADIAEVGPHKGGQGNQNIGGGTMWDLPRRARSMWGPPQKGLTLLGVCQGAT